MAFPMSVSGEFPLASRSAQGADAPRLLARLAEAFQDGGLGVAPRSSTLLAFHAGWGAPWPFMGCSGTLEIESGDPGRLTYRVSLRAWALALALAVPIAAFLLLEQERAIAPIHQFALLLVALPLGWLGAMALVHRVIGSRVRRRLADILGAVAG